MTVYLTIITTVLVLTQIIRVTQNTIQLRRQYKELKYHIKWFDDHEINDEDFEMQKKAYRLICEKLEDDGR